jgi:hypothetical protein
LSGIGKAFQPHVDELAERLVSAEKLSFSHFSDLVEREFVHFCKVLGSVDPFASGSWERAQSEFNGPNCTNLNSLLVRLVSTKGSNRNFGRQRKEIKLRKVAFVLLQLGKLRSEQFSGFAIKFATYLHFRGVPDAVSLVELQFGLTVDPNTRRNALDLWRQNNAATPIDALFLNHPDRVAFVGDNVNVFIGVRDIAAGVHSKQLNMFATAVWLRSLPSSNLSKISMTPTPFSARMLRPDAAGYARVRALVGWALEFYHLQFFRSRVLATASA